MTVFFKWLQLITMHRLKRFTVLHFLAINALDLGMYSVFRHQRDTSWTIQLQFHHPNVAKIPHVLRPLILLGTAPALFLTLSMPELYAHSRKLIVEISRNYFSIRQEEALWQRAYILIWEILACLKCAQSAVFLHSHWVPLIALTFSTFNLMILTPP